MNNAPVFIARELARINTQCRTELGEHYPDSVKPYIELIENTIEIHDCSPIDSITIIDELSIDGYDTNLLYAALVDVMRDSKKETCHG